MVLMASSFAGSMTALFFLLLVSESWFAPTITLLQNAVMRSVQGQAVSLFLVATIVCANLGPAIVGFWDPGDAKVGSHILWVAVLANLAAMAAFAWTAYEIT